MPAVSGTAPAPAEVLSARELEDLNDWWSAANYLCLAMLYLQDNPLLRRPLRPEDIKPRLLGHWGSDPGQTFILTHLNRLIARHDLNLLYVAGPGHGAPAVLANAYLEGTYSEVYPDRSRDEEGLRRFCKLFSFPGGVGSHCTPETPGSIHEGGELGYSLSHAFGAAFDNPELLVAAVVGDGEAETGPAATAWHSNKFLNPARDGAVLPILHLNGYKIANPTVLARISREELLHLMQGYGYTPHVVEGEEPEAMHRRMAAVAEECLRDIREIQRHSRHGGEAARHRWPMIILISPKGWTAPREVDGHRIEGSWRAHQIPILDARENPAHLALVERWLQSYRPGELFDADGRLIPRLAALANAGSRRISANPHANGGILRKPLRLPPFKEYAVPVERPGTTREEDTAVLGRFLRDILRDNPDNFRVFGPDETASNRLQAVYEVTGKTWLAERLPQDDDGGHLAPDGRVMEMLSEHTLEGWLEGYLLTGRHGLLNSYEAFAHVIDSMVNQHAKWIEKAKTEVPWRAPISSLNLLISSTVWRQDHNGFTHQDPGFLDLVTNKQAGVVRIYLPPDANCLLAVAAHCMASRDRVNAIVADKQAAPVWLDIDAARRHCSSGIGMFEWASNDDGGEPDVVMACSGDVPTLETLAAVDLCRRRFPDLKIRVVNVVDLMVLEPPGEHPHALSDRDFDDLFTKDKPVIFAFHGYPWLIHRLTYRRTNHDNIHVRGYKEEGSVTTPFDMAVANDLDRFHLVSDVAERVPKLASHAASTTQWRRDKLAEHERYIVATGEDLPEVRNWRWGGSD